MLQQVWVCPSTLATDLSWEASVPLESWKSLGLAEKVKEQLQSAADP